MKGTAHGASSTSMSVTRSLQAELLSKTALNILDEASMLNRKLFEMVSVTLKYLHCSSCHDSRPSFGGLLMVFAGYYLQLFSGVPSLRLVEGEDDNGGSVNVRLLHKLA